MNAMGKYRPTGITLTLLVSRDPLCSYSEECQKKMKFISYFYVILGIQLTENEEIHN